MTPHERDPASTKTVLAEMVEDGAAVDLIDLLIGHTAWDAALRMRAVSKRLRDLVDGHPVVGPKIRQRLADWDHSAVLHGVAADGWCRHRTRSSHNPRRAPIDNVSEAIIAVGVL